MKVSKIVWGGKEFSYLSEILMVLQQSSLLHRAFWSCMRNDSYSRILNGVFFVFTFQD